MDLLPCPHCGGFDALTVAGIQIGTKTTWRTICDAEDSGCGAQGGTALTKHAAAAAWNRRAATDPALLALDRELRIRSLLADRAANTAAANRELAEFGHWALDHDAFDREYADAIARLLAPDGAGEVARECKCRLRTRLVGDGCDVCNPELAAEYARQREVTDGD